MRTLMDDEIKRWTPRRKERAGSGEDHGGRGQRVHDLPPSEIAKWVEDGK